jgi:hypothetical protein
VTTVGSKGSEDKTQNGKRMNAGNQDLDIAISKDADILILPACFLFHNNSKSRQDFDYPQILLDLF